MGIGKYIIKGAAVQFGREFGRSTANSILKGENSYIIDHKYDGRINPSDTSIVRDIKEINKIDFVSADKNNISRLIKITNIIIPYIKFKGVDTLKKLEDFIKLNDVYNQKYEHGISLISDSYIGKDMTLLKDKRDDYEKNMKQFNDESNRFITTKKKNLLDRKKASEFTS